MTSRTTVLHLRIPCPYCETVCYIKSYKHKFLSFDCSGCTRVVIACDRLLLTVSAERFAAIESMFGTSVCGRVTSTDFKRRFSYKSVISEEDIEKVKKALDSDDLLSNLEGI